MAYAPPTSDEIVKNAKSIMYAAHKAMLLAQSTLADARLILNKAVSDGVPAPTLLVAALQTEMTTLKTNQDAMVTYLAAQAAGVK